jgi:hypothetical protein
MDPNANLREQLELAQRIRSAFDEDYPERITLGDVEALTDLVIALDGWLTRGGFLPAKWERPKGV